MCIIVVYYDSRIQNKCNHPTLAKKTRNIITRRLQGQFTSALNCETSQEKNIKNGNSNESFIVYIYHLYIV